MSGKKRQTSLPEFFRACLIVLLVDLLVFPPSMRADSIAWSSGTGNWSDTSKWTCTTCPNYPDNGNAGGPFDATINSGFGDAVTLDVSSTINSLVLGGSGSMNASTLTIASPNNLVLGTTTMVPPGTNVLTVSNGGTLNISGDMNGGSATLELSGGGTALNDVGGQISVTDGGTFALQNTNAHGSSSTIMNNGAISVVGTSSAANLVLNDAGNGNTFTLAGPGTLTLDGLGQITASTGQTFAVNNTLTNWSTGSTGGTLAGGNYTVANGATLSFLSIGAGNSIQTLSGNASVTVAGTGLLTGGGATPTNSLAGLTNITDSSLNLSGVTGLTITPGGSPATLTLAADTAGTPASLTLSGASNVTVNGGFTNQSTTDPSQNTSTLTIQGGSTFTTGAFLNQANNSGNEAQSTSLVNVLGGSHLNVDSLTTSTNSSFNASSTINITDSTLQVAHDVAQGGTTTFSQGNDTLNLTNSTGTVLGNFSNNNSANVSAVNLNNSSLTVDGFFSQMQTNGFGTSQLNLTGNSTMVVNGTFTNSTLDSFGTPQSQVSLMGGSSITVNGDGNFTNVSGQTLTGGDYYIGPGSSFNYTDSTGNITTIAANTILTLDGTGSINNLSNPMGNQSAIANSLETVTGTLAILNGSSLSLATLTNVDSLGNLSNGNFEIGNGSVLAYGNTQDVVNLEGNLILDGSGKLVSGSDPMGGDALSKSLIMVSSGGNLTLEAGANLSLTSSSFTNQGTVNVLGEVVNGVLRSSTLDLRNTIFNNVSGSDLTGANFEIGQGSFLYYAGGDIATIDNGATLSLDGDGTANGTGKLVSKSGSPDALSGSLREVDGTLNLQGGAVLNLTNPLTIGGVVSTNNGGNQLTAPGLTNNGLLQVGDNDTADFRTGGTGTFTKLVNGVLTGGAPLDVSGTFPYDISGTLRYDANTDTGGGAILEIQNTGVALRDGGQILYGPGAGMDAIANSLNLIDSDGSTPGASLLLSNLNNPLTLKPIGGALTVSTNDNVSDGNASLLLSGSTATIVGDLNNFSTTTMGGVPTSTIGLDSGSSLTVGNLNNTATDNGGGGSPGAGVILTNGSTLNVNGNFTSQAINNSPGSFPNGFTGINSVTQLSLDGISSAFITGDLNNLAIDNGGGALPTANVFLTNGSFLGVTNLNNKAIDKGGDGFPLALVSLESGSGLIATGNVTNQAINNSQGFGTLAQAELDLDSSSATIFGTLTNESTVPDLLDMSNNSLNAGATGGLAVISLADSSTLLVESDLVNTVNNNGLNTQGGTASISLSGGSTLTVEGNLSNTVNNGDDMGLSGDAFGGSASISLDASQLFVTGSLTNGAYNASDTFGGSAFLTLSNESVVTVGGLFLNDVGGTVTLSGGGNSLSGTGGLTNNGSLNVAAGDTADFRQGGATSTGFNTFTNLDLTGTLTGGSYDIGGTFNYDATTGTGAGAILAMQNASITLEGSGQILYGPGAGLDALASLSSLTDSNLTYNGAGTRTITPNGGTFSLSSPDSLGTSLNLNSGTNLTIDGNLTNGATGGWGTQVNLSGSSLTVDGNVTNSNSTFGNTISLSADGMAASTLTATGSLYNGTNASVNLNGGGNQLFAAGFTNNGSIFIGAGDTADFRTATMPTGTGDTFTNLVNGTLIGGTYSVIGTFNYDASAGAGGGQILGMSGSHLELEGPGQILYGTGAGADALQNLASLTNNSSLTIDGQTRTINPNGTTGAFTLSNSSLTLDSYTSGLTTTPTALTIDGTLQNGGTINLNDKSTLTVEGLATNSNFISLNGGGNQLFAQGFTNSGSIFVGAGDTADFRTVTTPTGTGDTFTNLTNGTLTGGSYTVAGTFNYDASAGTGGGQILSMSGSHITLEGPGQILYGPMGGSDTLVNLGSLTNNSSLTLAGQTRTFSPGGTNNPFIVGSSSGLTLNSYTDNTGTTTRSALTLTGALQNSGVISLYNQSTLSVGGLVTNNDFISLNSGGNSLVGSGFTNSGTITVGAGDTADFRTGGTPVGTGDTFTNLTNGTLTGGTYNVYGAFNYDASAGTGGGQILNMSGARITVGGAGAILYGPNLGEADALVNLGSLTNNSFLEVDGQTRTLNPGSGTFSLDTSSLTLNSYSNGISTSPAMLTIAGALQTATGGAINIYGGSSLAVQGGVAIGSNTYIALNSSGETLSGTSLTNNGGLTVAAGSTADFRSGTGTTLTNLSGNVLTGGTYDILGNLYYNAAPADGLIQKLSGANVTLGNTNSILFGPSGMTGTNPFTQLGELSNSTLTINGGSLATTPTSGVFKLDPSTLNLNSGTTLNITGSVNNSTGSAINLNGGGNTLTAQGFTNNGSLFVGAGDTADFRGNTFTNLSSTGVLTGGTYDIAGSFRFDASGAGGAAILNIADGTTVTLDSLGGNNVKILSGSGTDAIDSVKEVAGTFNIGGSGNSNADQVNMTRQLSPNGGTLTVDSTGVVNIATGGWSGVTTANITGSVAVNAGGQFNVGGASGSSSDGMGSSANLMNGGSFTNAGTVAINGEFNGITASGTFVNSGTLNVNGEGDFVSAQGLSNHSGTTGGTINIANGATLDARVGGAMGTSTNTFADLNGTTLQGNGTFNVGGTFIFDPSSGTNGGNIYTIGTGATLALTSSGAQVLFGPGSSPQDAIASLTEIAGTLNLSNNANKTFTPNGGTMMVDGTGAVNLSGGSALTVSGHLTNAGAFTQLDGNTTTVHIEGNLNNSVTGTYTVGYGSTTNVDLAVNNAAGGIINVNGGFDGSLAGKLAVTSGIDNFGSVNVNANGGFSSAGGILTAGSLVTNETTGTITVGSNASITAPGFTNTGNGTLSVLAAGLADFRGGSFTNLSGGTLTGGKYNVGGTFQFDSTSGVINKIGAGTSLTLDGQNSGLHHVLSGTSNALANLTGNAGTFTLTNGVTFATDTTANSGPGRFTNTGTLTTNGTGSNAFNVTGDVFNTSPGVVNVNGSGDTITASGQFNNSGTVSFGGTNDSITSTGDFTNAAAGMVTVTGSGNTLTTDAMLDNSGDITVGSGGSVQAALGFSQMGGTLTINNGGGVTVQGGNTFTQAGGTTTVNIGGTLTAGLVDLTGGALTGGGAIDGNLTVDGGTLNPGDPQSLEVTGNYDQTMAGILDIDLASPSSFDQVNVTGTAMLSGTLDLTLESGFSAAVGTVFDIVNWTTPTMTPGNFTTFNDVTFNNGTETFMEAVNGQHVDITVESTTVAPPVPEPSTLSMLVASLLAAGILWRRRRRQTAAAK